MLLFLDNPKKDPRITQFNAKIERYNHAIDNNQPIEALHLLQEIYYFQQQLTTLALDSLFDPSANRTLRCIFDWTGVRQELAHWLDEDNLPLSDLSTEMAFNFITGITDTEQTLAQWRSQLEATWYDTVSFIWGGIRNQALDENVKSLLAVHDEYGFASLNYFYALQSVKSRLLQTLNFSADSIINSLPYQTLLKQINGQIYAVINEVPLLRQRYLEHQSIAVALREDLAKASPEQKEQIAAIFSNIDFNRALDAEELSEMSEESQQEYATQMTRNKTEIHRILPSLDDMYVHKISSANNKTWVLQQEELGEVTVLRVEQPSPASLVQKLRNSPANEFLTQNYACCVSEYNPYPIIISEYSNEGDLRSHRKNPSKFNKSGVILQQAVKDMGQIARFCDEILKQKAMYPDIKLTNFLLTSDQHIFVNDLKGFKAVNEAGKILARDTIVTPPFAPPEYRNSLSMRHTHEGRPIELDADKFMSYQLGLSLYDHLVLPNDPDWSMKALDFSYPIFSTPQGKKLQTLIKLLTIKNPENRKGIQYALQQLESLQKPSAQMYMTLQVKSMRQGSGENQVETQGEVPIDKENRPNQSQEMEDVLVPSSEPETKNSKLK